MRPEELENRLLSSLRAPEDVLLAQREGVTAASFVTPEPHHGDVFDYIVEYTLEHGRVPTDDDLKSLHEFETTSSGDLKSYVQRVREDELGRNVLSILLGQRNEFGGESLADQFKKKPRDAIRQLSSEISELQTQTGRRITFLDRDAMERLKDYDVASASVKEQGVVGIPTGLRAFEGQNLGFRPGELVVVLGSTGVGKSWLLMYLACMAYQASKRVMIISPELTSGEQGARFDVCLANIRKQTLSNLDIITGQGSRSAYEDWLNPLTQRADFAVIDRSEAVGERLTYEDCRRYALELQPDVLVVDGLHLLATEGNEKGWEALKEGVDYLKALAQQQGLVVLCAHQPTRQAATKGETRPPTLSQIAYGFSVAQTADIILSMARVRDNPNARNYVVIKMRAGKPIIRLRKLHFDVDKGDIYEESDVEPEWDGKAEEQETEKPY